MSFQELAEQNAAYALRIMELERQQMARKPVQISVVQETAEYHGAVTALCDDGTIWILVNHAAGWEQLPGIPQPGQKN